MQWVLLEFNGTFFGAGLIHPNMFCLFLLNGVRMESQLGPRDIMGLHWDFPQRLLSYTQPFGNLDVIGSIHFGLPS